MLVENATSPWGQSWERVFHKHSCIHLCQWKTLSQDCPHIYRYFNFGGKFEFRPQLSLITDGPKFNSKQVLFNIGILNLSLQIRLFVIFVKSNATAKKNLMSIQLLNTKVKKIILAQFVRPTSMQSISYQTIYKRIIVKKLKSIYVKFVMSDLLIQKD